jgi:outer membrane receptor protein involved in Fe transport
MGADINYQILKNIFIYSGYSYYGKPYNILEEKSLSAAGSVPTQDITNFEAGVRYINRNTDFRLSYFRTDNNNSPVPVAELQTVAPNYLLYYSGTRARKVEGINAKFGYKYWKILFAGNTTSLLNVESELVNSPAFTFDGGVYFVDTLFNKNLDLKAGFSFKYYSSQNYFIYDFEKSMSAQMLLSPGGSLSIAGEKTTNVFRIDFFLAGKVQESAIVYFTFENLLNTKYYIVPFYPALGRNIRFGISWEFLD